jgi:RNA 3'-terminal phosphate cyclase
MAVELKINADFRPQGGEAGGQVIRMIAAAINFLPIGSTIDVENIRAGRPGKKGLRPQHVQCLEMIREICGCQMEGVQEHSGAVTLKSVGAPIPGNYRNAPLVDDSAASATLIVQAVLPVLLFAPGKSVVYITGGLDTSFSPSIYHTMDILRPILGFFDIEIVKNVPRGKGGGEVMLTVNGLAKGETFPPLHVIETDAKLTDQVIIYMALARGRSVVTSRFEPTTHTKSQIMLMEMLFPGIVFTVSTCEEMWMITCHGIGFHTST